MSDLDAFAKLVGALSLARGSGVHRRMGAPALPPPLFGRATKSQITGRC